MTLFVALMVTAAGNAQQPTEAVRLPGHVLELLPSAARLPRNPRAVRERMILTIVLNRPDPDGFEAFRQAFHDPASPSFHQGIAAHELAARFGPSQAAYDAVLAWLRQNGFELLAGSENRIALTVQGTRAQVERAFGVSIDDYQLGTRQFHANDTDPAIPAALAPLIRGVSGLANLARAHPATAPSPPTPLSLAAAYDGTVTASGSNSGGLPPGITGAGQTVGIIAFDNFNTSDFVNTLNAEGLPAGMVNQVSTVNVAGGTTPTNGLGTIEVLLDLTSVLGVAPGANVVVFDAYPGNVDYVSMLQIASQFLSSQKNGGHGGILSQSFVQCEYEVSNAEADSMEAVLQGFPLAGLSFFTGSGDNGSTCVDNGVLYPNRVDYPADAPSAVAVGGTTLQVGGNNSYLTESWWTTANNAGGFGVSWHFGVPIWQRTYTTSATRSVPDVSADAGDGITLCLGATNGSPNCFRAGGTSMSGPLWAGIWALAVQAYVEAHPGAPFFPSANGGFLYTLPYYPNTFTNAFHTAGSLTGAGNDFAHVGLGSPDITNVVAKVAGVPSISSMSISSGSDMGGESVVISGNAFVGVQSVLFGQVAAKFSVISETQLQVTSPAQQTGVGSMYVTVITPAGYSQNNSASAFYVCPPVLTVTPNIGSIAGGDQITVTGYGFNTQNYPNTTPFLFGGYAATNVFCSSSSTCTMLNPAHPAGPVNVTVGLPGSLDPGTLHQFTYSGPAVTSISPSIGSQWGGTIVDLHGYGFSSSMTVKFGNATGTFYCHSSLWCTATSPAGTGQVNVVVTVSGMTSAASVHNLFTYEPFPVIFFSSPLNGTAGTPVTVQGVNFRTAPGETTFMFGSSPATNVQCTTTALCTMIAPTLNGSLDPGYEVEISVTDTFYVTFLGFRILEVWTTYGGVFGATYGGWFTYPPPPPIKNPCKGTTCQ